jgi:hypothetical protein
MQIREIDIGNPKGLGDAQCESSVEFRNHTIFEEKSPSGEKTVPYNENILYLRAPCRRRLRGLCGGPEVVSQCENQVRGLSADEMLMMDFNSVRPLISNHFKTAFILPGAVRQPAGLLSRYGLECGGSVYARVQVGHATLKGKVEYRLLTQAACVRPLVRRSTAFDRKIIVSGASTSLHTKRRGRGFAPSVPTCCPSASEAATDDRCGGNKCPKRGACPIYVELETDVFRVSSLNARRRGLYPRVEITVE